MLTTTTTTDVLWNLPANVMAQQQRNTKKKMEGKCIKEED